jgi:hypothetical protein
VPLPSGERITLMALSGLRTRRTVEWILACASLWPLSTPVAAAAANPAATEDTKLPSAEFVLQRFVDVTGGSQALLHHKSMTIHGRYEVPARRIDVQSVSYTKEGRDLQIVMLPSGKSLSGYDGHTAWDLDANGTVTIHEGEEVRSIARDADMYYRLHVMNYFRSLEVIDVQDFNGHSCYHLKGINNWGKPNEQFYDRASGLLIGYAYNTAWRGGHGAATTLFEDYRDFGGLRFAARITNHDGEELSTFAITSISYDDVDDSVFVLPPPVRARLLQH